MQTYQWRQRHTSLYSVCCLSACFHISAVKYETQLTYVALLISTSSIPQREEDQAPLK